MPSALMCKLRAESDQVGLVARRAVDELDHEQHEGDEGERVADGLRKCAKPIRRLACRAFNVPPSHTIAGSKGVHDQGDEQPRHEQWTGMLGREERTLLRTRRGRASESCAT